jgi:hypothetical protein
MYSGKIAVPPGGGGIVAGSPKRIETLKEFQLFTHTKIHKILHPAQTRWLSLESVVKNT